MADENYAELAALSRSITPDDRLRHTPPPSIWRNIAATVDDEVGLGGPDQRHRQRSLLLLASAAAVVAFLLGVALLTRGNDPDVLFAAEVSNATLNEPYEGSATAMIVDPEAPVLEIEFDGMLPTSEPVELWLIKNDLSEMRSLGIVDPGAASWSGGWPADLDPTEFSLVDLSIEPDDGDAAHSGRSILRGRLVES